MDVESSSFSVGDAVREFRVTLAQLSMLDILVRLAIGILFAATGSALSSRGAQSGTKHTLAEAPRPRSPQEATDTCSKMGLSWFGRGLILLLNKEKWNWPRRLGQDV